MVQLEIPGMPEPNGPPTKRCSHCLERKALGRFSLDLSRPHGFCRICRDCDGARHRKRWRENPERMRAKARQKYQRTNTPENRERNAQRRRSDRGKAINLAAVKLYQNRNREKRSAHTAVSRAIRAGILQRPEYCELAHLGGCSGRAEYHHPDYSKPLDVIPLCVEHHAATHHKPRLYESEASLFEIVPGTVIEGLGLRPLKKGFWAGGQSKGRQTQVSAQLVSDEVSTAEGP